MARDWIVYGVRSAYVHDVAACIRRSGDGIRAFVDNMAGPGVAEDLQPLLTPEELGEDLHRIPLIVPLVTPGNRKKAVDEVQAAGFTAFPPFWDKTAIIADDVEMDIGCQANAGTVIAAQSKLGRFVLVNRSASVGHHAILEDFVSIGPGAVLCGECTIGRGTFIGAGSVLGPQVTIGPNATIAAGAVVMKDVPEFGIVSGNPAAVRAVRRSGYRGHTI